MSTIDARSTHVKHPSRIRYMPGAGVDLPLLLLTAFRLLAHEGTAKLASRGYADISTGQSLALRAIFLGANSASELARSTAVAKQSAARTISDLENGGYLTRAPNPDDKRSTCLFLTERGSAMLSEGELIYDALREDWRRQVGARDLERFEATLRKLAELVDDHPTKLQR